MKLAIAHLSYAERQDLKREAKVYTRRQGNAHLGDTPIREDLRAFFRKFRDLIMTGKRFNSALDRLDLDYCNMDDM